MAELKTFVFTDIAGSVKLKDEMPGRSTTERDRAFVEMVLTPHRERIERELAAHGGRVVSTAGDGHFLVFSDTILAARWAVGVQESHRDVPIRTPPGTTILCRISIHVGIPQVDPRDEGNFIGKPVDYAARLNDYATAGQVLVSRSVVSILEDAGMEGITFHLHGRRELKGIGRVELHELVYEASGPRRTRNTPKEKDERQWTVLPTNVGQTEIFGGGAVTTSRAASTKRKLGNYELGELLGSGGMGNVYQAKHTQFGRVRAVKVIKQHFVDAGHEEIIRRFYREIRAVGRLEHPNVVVAIESSAPTDSVHYLVMEYIDGVSVDQYVNEFGAFAIADACEVGRQAAIGLEYIHQNQMVHRDIKPSNLMLTLAPGDSSIGSVGSLEWSPDGGPEGPRRALVKLLDLGLALLAADEEERFTRFENRAMGTGMYMAPEQWRTTSVDIRADIYSLGCTLYHLLAGKPPFADSDLRPQRAHELAKLPKISRSDQPIPRPLWTVLRKMTAKKPEDRYETPLEVALALEPFCAGQNLGAIVQRHRLEAETITKPKTGSDTDVSDVGRKDTQWGDRSRSRPLPSDVDTRGRRLSWPTAAMILLLALFVAGIWMMVGPSGGGSSDRWQQNLILTADFAARDIETEIERRINILNRAVSDPSLSRMIRRLETMPEDMEDEERIEARESLENWLLARKLEHVDDAPSESWFLTNDQGIQIARSPLSRDSLGKSYAHRDYFHGRGRDLEPGSEEARNAPPLKEPHQSAVYESTSTGHLKIGFSAPVWYTKRGSREQEVIGVLGMSVDLNEFYVLEAQLLEGQQVVLLNLGTDFVDSDSGDRGLILHHPQIKEGQGRRASPKLLQLIDAALVRFDAGGAARAIPLSAYQDRAVTGGETFRGAVTRVRDRKSITSPAATDWVVLVQEPAKD